MLINVLEIGTERFTQGDTKRQSLLNSRRIECAKYLESLTLILSCISNFRKNKIGIVKEQESKNLELYIIYTKKIPYFLNIFYPFKIYKLSRSICKSKKIDLISTQDPFISSIVGYFLKRTLKIPLNIQIHTDMIDNKDWAIGIKGKIYSIIYNNISKFNIKRADSIRVVSNNIKNKLIDFGIPKEKISVIPTPININDFKEPNDLAVEMLRKKYLGTNNKKVILFIGRLSPEKNLLLLLKSFSLVVEKYPAVDLVIIGSGNQEKILKEKAQNLHITENVKFLGAVRHSIVPFFYNMCDIFVLTSRVEGRATVLIEAAISKKPIIVTNISGANDVVKNNETGFIIEQGDCAMLAEKILFLLENTDIATKFGDRGYCFVKEKVKNADSSESITRCWKKTVNSTL